MRYAQARFRARFDDSRPPFPFHHRHRPDDRQPARHRRDRRDRSTRGHRRGEESEHAGESNGGHRRGGTVHPLRAAAGHLHDHRDPDRLRPEDGDGAARAQPGGDAEDRADAEDDGRDHRHRGGRDGGDRVDDGRPQPRPEGVPVAADRSQLRVGRPARLRRQHRQLRPAPAVHDRLRRDRAREQLPRRRRQHDGRRDRKPGQGAQLRVHPGDRAQGGRLRGRVRRSPGRNPERRDQVRRQHVPRRRLRLPGPRQAPGSEQAHRRDHVGGHPDRLREVRLRARPRRLHHQGPPLVLRRVRPRPQRPGSADHAGRRGGNDRVDRHEGQSLLRQADVEDLGGAHPDRDRLRRPDRRQRRGRADHRPAVDVHRHRHGRRHGPRRPLRGRSGLELPADRPVRLSPGERRPAARARRQPDRLPGPDRRRDHRVRRMGRRRGHEPVRPQEVHAVRLPPRRELLPREPRHQGGRRVRARRRGRLPRLQRRSARPDPPAVGGRPAAAARLLPRLLRRSGRDGRQPDARAGPRVPAARRDLDLRARSIQRPAEPHGQRRSALGEAAHQGAGPDHVHRREPLLAARGSHLGLHERRPGQALRVVQQLRADRSARHEHPVAERRARRGHVQLRSRRPHVQPRRRAARTRTRSA